MAAKRARGPVVARDPLLVEVAGGPGDGGHGLAPRQPVRGAVDVEVVGARSLGDAERGSQPHAVCGVVRDDRVARALGRARPRRRVGDSGKQAGLPGRSSVARRGEADGDRASLEDAPDLEDRDDRRAEREGVGLDLRGVLTDRVARAVARDLPRDDFAVARDGVCWSAVTMSRPVPQRTVSRVPSPWAGTRSSPCRPRYDVAPRASEDDVGAGRPQIVSLPARPSRTSARGVPVSTSARGVPVTVAADARPVSSAPAATATERRSMPPTVARTDTSRCRTGPRVSHSD